MDNKIFPKYAKILSSDMVRIGCDGKSAEYFKPCGEWLGKVEYDEGQYNLTKGGLCRECINLKKITALDFLKSNSYGYSDLSEKVFKEALKDCGEEPKVRRFIDRIDYAIIHKYSDF